MTKRTFKTRLINHRRVPVIVRDFDGYELAELLPGHYFEVESCNPETLFAPYTEACWQSNGTVTFVERPGFFIDRGRWTLKLLNRDGRETESRVVGGKFILLPRGIPVVVGLTLNDPLVTFQSLTITRKPVLVRDQEHFGYLRNDVIAEDELEKRDASELRALDQLLEKS